MSSFSQVLVKEGVEVEIPGDLTSVIALLDQEVPWFSCDGHEFQLTSSRAQLGARWDLSIKLIDSATRRPAPSPVGRIELETLGNGGIVFRIPPRDSHDPAEPVQFDPVGHYYGSFAFQILNMLDRRDLIDLPGVLPTM